MSPDRPAIKGTAFVSAISDLQELLASGRLSRAALEERLPEEDLEIIDGKILPSLYPIETYGRVLDVLGDVHGGGIDYHVQRGRRAAERLLRSGIYRQLDRAIEQRRTKDENSLIGLMLTVGRTLYNFGEWEVVRDAGDGKTFRFEIRGAAALPDSGRYAVQGFVEWAVEHIVGPGRRVESRRPRPDVVVVEISRP